jgi:ankyrin repeat protein
MSSHQLYTAFKANKGKFVEEEVIQKKHLKELEEIKRELSVGEYKINSQLKDGRTPLYVAVCNNNLVAVKYLIELGANLEIEEYENGNTALMAAISLGYNQVIDYLISSGANIHAINKNDNTIIHFAAICDNLPIVQYAFEHGCDINKKDKEGNCAILFAAGNGFKKIVDYLLEQDAEIDIIDSEKMSLLHICILHDRNEILNSILYKNRTTINKYYGDYKTPLYWASLTNKYKSVYVLIMYGAKPNLNDYLDYSPLYWAVFNQNYEMVKLLIEFGSDIHCRYRLGGFSQSLGDSILRTAKRGYTPSIVELLEDSGGIDYSEY